MDHQYTQTHVTGKHERNSSIFVQIIFSKKQATPTTHEKRKRDGSTLTGKPPKQHTKEIYKTSGVEL